MTEQKPTPGVWEARRSDYYGTWRVVESDGTIRADRLSEEEARLIAEAGTVYHESGRSPRQLAERVRELEEALGDSIDRLERMMIASGLDPKDVKNSLVGYRAALAQAGADQGGE